MSLNDAEKELLDLLAKYSFLEQLKHKGVITEESFDKLLHSFGADNLERINCYLRRLDEYYRDTSAFLDKSEDSLQMKKDKK